MEGKVAKFLLLLQISSVFSIFNGYRAKPHQFPFIVLLNSPKFYCAGSLISPQHVLTAAHCLMSVKPGGSIRVTLGAHEYYGNSQSDGKMVLSDEFYIHENFSMPSAVHDIGLVKLPSPIAFSSASRFIQVDSRRNIDAFLENSEVLVAGWGKISENEIAQGLRYTLMRVITMWKCWTFRDNYVELLTRNHICAEKITTLPCE